MKSFDLYNESIKYFKEKFLNVIFQNNFPHCFVNKCHKMLMENYFEIIDNLGNIIQWTTFWGDATPTNWGILKNNDKTYEPKYRLNIIVVDKNLKPLSKNKLNIEYKNLTAKIVYIFPIKVREDFNKYLIFNNNSSTRINSDTTYNIFQTCNPEQYIKILAFKNDILADNYYLVEDVEQPIEDLEELAEDSDKDDLEVFNEEINQKKKWATDLNNNLWKQKLYIHDKNFSFKWTKYSTEKIITDANLFENNDFCGHLYLFKNKDKCVEFFKYMVDNKGYTPYGLIILINDPEFVCNSEELQKNIDNVNPIYVIGTLRIFGFKKYLKHCNDGTKIIKFESYNNWWTRKSVELEKAKNEYNLSYNLVPTKNFKLFFNLLILYINNNEFVFNPQKNEFFNNLVSTKNDGITDLLRISNQNESDIHLSIDVSKELDERMKKIDKVNNLLLNNKLKPFSRDTLLVFIQNNYSLKKKNIQIDHEFINNLFVNILKLTELENNLYLDLELIINYVKAINVLNVSIPKNIATRDIMDDTVKKYEKQIIKNKNCKIKKWFSA